MERIFFDAQAGILAAGLKEGEKCPVCGSAHHPSPAAMVEGAPDKEALDLQKEKVEKLERRASDLSAAAGASVSLTAKAGEDFEAGLKEFSGEPIKLQNTEKVVEIIGSQKAVLQEKLSLLNEKIKRKTQLEKELAEGQKNLDYMTQKDRSLSENIAAMTARKEQLTEQLQALKAEKEERTEEQRHAEQLAFEEKKAALKEEQETLIQEKNRQKKNVTPFMCKWKTTLLF